MSGAAFRHKLIAHLIAAVALTVPPTLDLRHSISSLLTGLFPEFLSPVFTPAPASIDSPGPHAPGFPPLLPGLPDIPNPVLSWLISWLSPAPGQESGRDENCGGGSPLQDAVVEGGEESRGDGSSGSFLAAAAESLFEELLRGTGESEVPSCGRASEDAGAGDITEEEVRVWASDADRAARLACLHAVSLGVSEAPGFSSVPSWARSLASSSSRVYRRAYGARGHAERTLCALSALFRVLSQQLWALSWKERTGGGAQHVSMREALPVAHLCAACLWILLRAAPEASAFARAHIGELMDGGRGNEKEDDTGGVGSEGGGAGMTCRLAAEALGGGISACISILRSGASWTSVVGCLMEEMEKGPRGHAGGAVGEWPFATLGRVVLRRRYDPVAACRSGVFRTGGFRTAQVRTRSGRRLQSLLRSLCQYPWRTSQTHVLALPVNVQPPVPPQTRSLCTARLISV